MADLWDDDDDAGPAVGWLKADFPWLQSLKRNPGPGRCPTRGGRVRYKAVEEDDPGYENIRRAYEDGEGE